MAFRALLLIGFLLLSSLGTVVAQDSKTDDRIHDLVMVKLAGDQIVAGAGRIEVEVAAGVVTLKGRVESDKQKGRAGQLAKHVKGVKSVDNQIKVEPR